jgi:molecular chaperone GrpE
MNDESRDDVDFEAAEDMCDMSAALAKLKKLRAELKESQAKRDEYLAGWQRAKADAINDRRDALQSAQRTVERAREAFVEDLLPALDSFDMAISGEGWESVSNEWRTGIGYIQNQLIAVLERNGIKRFGISGEPFDPFRHEAVQEVDDGSGESQTVLKVLRYGYAQGDRVLRPAQVIVRK